jgi:UDP-2,4-diacetamido-2,4,6-trideoxy-beta-L-altropyranose hydrolase
MNLLFRTDASVSIGTGHVMRSLALAQAWQDGGGRASFAMTEATPAVEARLRNEGVEVVRLSVVVGSVADASETARLAREHAASWVVVDGYRFGAEYQASLKGQGLKVLFVDDNGHAGHYSADLVLNQNAHASEALYPDREASTRLLLGPRFAVLRREFAPWREWKRDIPEAARQVLVTMGGSDPGNVTERVIEAILSERGLTATVVVGGSNPHLPRLRAVAGKAGSALQLVENATNMSELMARADIAVAGAGTTSWEMCFLGLPALLIVLADNQRGVADELSRQGIASHLGSSSEVTRNTIARELRKLASSLVVRKSMSERGRYLVDGRGAERVAAAMKAESLSIRLAEDGDCKLFWEWANDPAVRTSAFSPDAIPWEQHVAWFRRKLQDETCRILLALDDSDVPIGQIRFDKIGLGEADIDITIGSRFRGLGYASRLIELGANQVFAERHLQRLHAFVKPENIASAKAFEKAGFARLEVATVKGQPAVHFIRTVE